MSHIIISGDQLSVQFSYPRDQTKKAIRNVIQCNSSPVAIPAVEVERLVSYTGQGSWWKLSSPKRYKLPMKFNQTLIYS